MAASYKALLLIWLAVLQTSYGDNDIRAEDNSTGPEDSVWRREDRDYEEKRPWKDLSHVKLELGEVEKVPMGQTRQLEVRLSGISVTEVLVMVNLSDPTNSAVEILNQSLTFTPDDIRKSRAQLLTIYGSIIGINHLQFWLANTTTLLHSQPVATIIANNILNQAFLLVMTLMVVVNTVNMGAQLDLDIIRKVFRRPVGPLVGFAAQFFFMPAISLLVGYLFTEDKLFRLGLFVLGCSPGGNGSNFWTLLLEGDVNLSITMTFVSTVAALGMMPAWIFLVGPYLTEGNLVIPFGQLITSLIGLILPLALGMWIRWKWAKAAKIMERIIVPFTLLTVLFILTAGVYINLFIFQLITPLMIAAGFAVALSGYLFGAALAWAFRLEMAQITAVSIETSFQNGGIAFVLLKMSFPEPQGELASVAPVAQLMITGLPLWGFLAALKLYRCMKVRGAKDADANATAAGDYEAVPEKAEEKLST